MTALSCRAPKLRSLRALWQNGREDALLKDPATITLRQMVEAVEGPICLNVCLIRPGECPRDRFCPVHPVWARIQAVFIWELDAVTAKDLAETPVVSPAGGQAV